MLSGVSAESTRYERGKQMSIGDKVSGRVKQAAGDLAGDEDLKRQGGKEERKGDVKEDAAEAENEAAAKREEAANLERDT